MGTALLGGTLRSQLFSTGRQACSTLQERTVKKRVRNNDCALCIALKQSAISVTFGRRRTAASGLLAGPYLPPLSTLTREAIVPRSLRGPDFIQSEEPGAVDATLTSSNQPIVAVHGAPLPHSPLHATHKLHRAEESEPKKLPQSFHVSLNRKKGWPPS